MIDVDVSLGRDSRIKKTRNPVFVDNSDYVTDGVTQTETRTRAWRHHPIVRGNSARTQGALYRYIP